MATTADIPRLEMLQVADMVAREKGIEREEVLEAMEQAIQKSGRAKYGLEHYIRAEIDRKTGEIKLLRYMQVADPIENENTQVTVVEAQRRNPEAQVGDFLTDELPPIVALMVPVAASATSTAAKVTGTRIDGGGRRIASIGRIAPIVKASADAPAACHGLTTSSSAMPSSAARCAASASCAVSSCATCIAVVRLSPLAS